MLALPGTSTLSLSRGARISIVFTVVRITPWDLQRKILLCMRTISLISYLYSTDLALPGVAVFFFLQFVMLTVQVYWVCELSYAQWKQIPGSVCVLPKVVPISQVVSKPPPPLVPLPVCLSAGSSAAVVSDAILVIAPLTVWKNFRFSALGHTSRCV